MATYHRLYFQCPACLSRGQRTAPAGYWYHGACGGPLEIGGDATVRCADCRYTSHVRNWRYSCENHTGQYRGTTSAHFAGSISMSAALVAAGGRSWLLNVLDNLADW